MPHRPHLRVALVAALLASLYTSAFATAGTHAPRKTMQAFASEHEIAQLFAKWSEEHQRRLVGFAAVCAQPLARAHRARRVLFIRNRVFALLGYEIVEGRIVGSQIAEVCRISFSPNRVDRVGTMSQ